MTTASASPATSTTPASPASSPSRPAPPAPGPDEAASTAGGFSVAEWVKRNQFALRRLHSLTGVVFGGYVVVHLLINATLIEGVRYDAAAGLPSVYQQQVDRIHALPFLNLVAWSVILLPIIYHTLYGIVILASGRPNVANYGYGKNWLYLLQRISAIVLIFFIAFHYLGMKGAFPGDFGAQLTFVPVNDPDTPYSEATQSTVNHIHAAWWIGWVIYPLGVLAGTFHLANGFWTAGVTWGLTISAKAQRLWGFACTGLFVFTFICGMTALGAALAQTPTDGPLESQRRIPMRVGEKAPDAEIAEEINGELPGVVQPDAPERP